MRGLDGPIASLQKSAVGGSNSPPHVRTNTSRMTSMAMSQRMPSHWSAIPASSSRSATLVSRGDSPAAPCRSTRCSGDRGRAQKSGGMTGDLTREVILRLTRESIGPGLDEAVRILGHPRVIDRQMVGHEIKDQAEANLSEPRSKHGECLRPAQAGVHRVPVNGVRRAYDIRSGEVGQSTW